MTCGHKLKPANHQKFSNSPKFYPSKIKFTRQIESTREFKVKFKEHTSYCGIVSEMTTTCICITYQTSFIALHFG